MRCESCGFENPENFAYCPNCGAPAESTPPVTSSTWRPAAENKILLALQDSLFFVLCILMSASCAIQLISSGPDVLTILFTIFLWLVYAQARKGIADANHLRSVSGTVYANYILVNVAAILLITVGAILGFAFGALAGDPTFLNELLSLLETAPVDVSVFTQLLASVSGVVIFISFALIGGVMLVINLFSLRYIHRFAKSVYQSVVSGSLELKHTKAAYGWLIAFGVFAGITFLRTLRSVDLLMILNGGINCAMYILSAILIKKHLVPAE